LATTTWRHCERLENKLAQHGMILPATAQLLVNNNSLFIEKNVSQKGWAR